MGISADDLMHAVLVGMSLVLVIVALYGFRRRPNRRYLFLLSAFIFFALDQLVILWQQLYTGGSLLSLPLVDLHLTHVLEFLMALSFLAALVYPARLPWGSSAGD